MTPIALAVLGAAALGGGYVAFKGATKPKAIEPGKVPVDPVTMQVYELQKGRTYAIVVAFDLKALKADWSAYAGNMQKAASDWLKGNLTQKGFKVLTDPKPRDEAEAKKFFAGEVSAWVVSAQWLRDEKYVGGDPDPAVPNAAFYLIPVS